MTTKFIKVKWWFGFSAFTLYPFIFYVGTLGNLTRKHELIHIDQQKRWCKWYTLWIVGLIAWFFMYLLILPVGWNYWRYKWEREAYTKGSGINEALTKKILSRDYFLWWH